MSAEDQNADVDAIKTERLSNVETALIAGASAKNIEQSFIAVMFTLQTVMACVLFTQMTAIRMRLTVADKHPEKKWTLAAVILSLRQRNPKRVN